ncbi:MAG TPA: hypothetical protein VN864_08555 [Thermoplasmata archaeon]|nr:hypothetical protein [Thermoplasmata archaeon]
MEFFEYGDPRCPHKPEEKSHSGTPCLMPRSPSDPAFAAHRETMRTVARVTTAARYELDMERQRCDRQVRDLGDGIFDVPYADWPRPRFAVDLTLDPEPSA